MAAAAIPDDVKSCSAVKNFWDLWKIRLRSRFPYIDFLFYLTRRNSRSISFQQPCLRLSTTHPSSSQIIISLPSSVKVQCFLDFRKCFSISQYLARVSYFSKAFQCDWPAWLKERWFVFIRISTADSQTLMFLCRRFFVN